MGIFVIGIGDSQKKSTPLAPSVVSQSDSGSNRSFDDGAAYITFNDTIFDGKLPIIDYLVTAVSEANDTLSFTINSIAPFVATGLKSGVKYKYKIKARNALGYSADSSETGLNTATTVPGRPTSLGVVDVRNGGSLDLAWIAPANGGAAIKGYYITPSVGSVIDTGSSTAYYRYSGTVGTPVSFTVSAYNDNGTGQASAVSIAVQPTAAPVTTTTTTPPGGGGVVSVCTQSSSTASVDRTTVYGTFNRPILRVDWNGTSIPFTWNGGNISITSPSGTAGSTVSVYVENGCYPPMSTLSYTYPVPPGCTLPSNLVGGTYDAAVTAVQNAGYVPVAGYVDTSNSTLAGYVQSISASSSACGSTVTINQYRYVAPPVTVTCGGALGTNTSSPYPVSFGPFPTVCSGYPEYVVVSDKCSDGTSANTRTSCLGTQTISQTLPSCPGTVTNVLNYTCADLGLTSLGGSTSYSIGSLQQCCGGAASTGGTTGTSTSIVTPTQTSTLSASNCQGPCLGTWTIVSGVCQCVTPTATSTSTPVCVADFERYYPTACGGRGGSRTVDTCGNLGPLVCNPAPTATATATQTATTNTNVVTATLVTTYVTNSTSVVTASTTVVYTPPNTTVTTRTTTRTACLVGKTLISTPNGLVKAEDIKVGDLVNSVRFAELSTNETVDTIDLWNSRSLTPVYTTNSVVKKVAIKEEVDFYLNLNGDYMTPEHRVLVKADGKYQFMEAGDIHIGYEVLKKVGPGLKDLQWTPVVINDIVEEKAMVYLFDTEEDDVIFTENMLTHNIKL